MRVALSETPVWWLWLVVVVVVVVVVLVTIESVCMITAPHECTELPAN